MTNGPNRTYEDCERRIAELEQALLKSDRAREPQDKEDFRLLQTIFNSIEQPISFVSKEYRYQAVNKAYADSFALDMNQILGRSVAEICGVSVFDSEIRPNLSRCLAGENVAYEVQVDFPGKGLRWMEMEYIPHRNEHGEILGVISHGQDITGRKASEAKLQAKEKRLQIIAEACKTCLWQVDLNRRILYASASVQKLFGYSQQEAMGLDFAVFFPEEKHDAADQAYQAGLSGQQTPHSLELTGKRKDGTLFPVEVTITPMFQDKTVIGAQGISRDISERKQYQKDLRQALEKTRMREQELKGLLAVAHTVLIHNSFAEAAPAILQACCRQIDADLTFLAECTAGTPCPETFFLEPKLDGPGKDLPQALFKAFQEDLLAGKMMRKNKSLSSAYWTSIAPAGLAPPEDLLLIPLMIDDTLAGMLALIKNSGVFKDSLVRLATGFSELAGIALRNSRNLSLLHEVNSELEKRVEERTEALTQANAELEQTMHALRENEARFTAFMDHFPGGAFIKEVNGPIIFRNQYLKEFFEHGGPWIGKTISEILPEHLSGPILEDEQKLSQASPRTREFSIPDGRGQPRVVELHKFLIKQTGKPDLIGGIGLDVTDKKDSQKKVRKSRAMLQAVFDGISDPLFMVDETLTIKMLNKAAAAYIGASYTDAVGRSCLVAFSCRAGSCTDCRITEKLRAQERISFERTGCFDSHKREQVDVYPLGAETALEENGAVVHIRDITQNKKLEQELLQADKMISLGILVSGVAHEINNPNNFIMLNTPLLQEIWDSIQGLLAQAQQEQGDLVIAGLSYPELLEKVPMLFSGITEGSQRIKTIVQGLKDFARHDDMNLQEEVDVNRVVEQSVLLLKNMIQQASSNFTLDLDPDLPVIRGNAQKLEQVVINLLQNACQALSSPDKALTVQTLSDPRGRGILIRISDEGEGIPRESLPRIMDPFFTTRRSSGGTGIGLSVSRNIVKEHGGSIEVESRIGLGTTFQVILPFEKPPVKNSEKVRVALE